MINVYRENVRKLRLDQQQKFLLQKEQFNQLIGKLKMDLQDSLKK